MNYELKCGYNVSTTCKGVIYIKEINGIKALYVYSKNEYKDYVSEMFLKKNEMDKYFIKTLMYIQSVIKDNIYIENNNLFDGKNKNIDKNNSFSFKVKDRLGQLRETKIIKSIISQNNIYELRINTEHIKYRVLFFATDKNDDLKIKGNFLDLTFGFKKQYKEIDLTDELSFESQLIFDDIYDYKIDFNSIFK